MKILKITLFSTLLIFSNLSFACKFIPNYDSLETKISNSQLAFIGKINKIFNNEVTFTIERNFKNKDDKNYVVITQGQTSCHDRYEEGDKWLFLGNSMPMRSILLERNGKTTNTVDIK